MAEDGNSKGRDLRGREGEWRGDGGKGGAV